MVGKEGDPASSWVPVTFQGRTVQLRGGYRLKLPPPLIMWEYFFLMSEDCGIYFSARQECPKGHPSRGHTGVIQNSGIPQMTIEDTTQTMINTRDKRINIQSSFEIPIFWIAAPQITVALAIPSDFWYGGCGFLRSFRRLWTTCWPM